MINRKNIIFSLTFLLLCVSFVYADHIYVADLTNLDANSYFWPAESMCDTMKSFQGAVNRGAGSPKLYLLIYPRDMNWIEDINETFGYSYSIYDDPNLAFTDPNLTQYCSEFVVYDETDCNLAINAAVTQAGIYGNCCIVEKSYVDLMESYGFDQNDSVDANLCGKWTTNEDCQEWQYNNQLDDCNDKWLCWSEGDIEGRNKNVDFCVANNLFTYCGDADGVHLNDSETTQRDILSSFEPNSIITGWWAKENPDVYRACEYGCTVAGGGPNMSVFQMLNCTIGNQNTTASLRDYDPNKTYVMFSFTQGGAMNNCMEDNYDHLEDLSITDPNYKVSERYPFGLIHTTIQALWQPSVPKKLYSMTDPNQLFFGWPFGYVKPSVLDANGYLEGHFVKARELMDLMDINDVIINDNYGEGDVGSMTKIATTLQPRSIIFKHQLYTDSSEDDEVAFVDGIPIFADPVFCRRDANKALIVQDTIDAIEASAAKRQWFWIFLQHTVDANEIEPVMDSIAENEDIVIMPPDEFIRLCIKNGVTTSFNPTDDAYVRHTNPSTTSGGATVLRVRGSESNEEVYSFLKFTVSDLIDTVNSATLRLHAEDANIENCTVYAVNDSNWSEDTLTWNNMPSMGSSLDTVTNTSSGTWAEFDVNSFITGDGTYSLGLTTTIDALGRDWYSKDCGDSNSFPMLVLTGFPALPAPKKSLSPTDDAFVSENNSSANYGSNIALRVRGSGSNKEVYSYLKFTVSDTSNIISATLKLRAETKDIENCTVYSVSDTSWAEGTITWNNKPSMGSSLDSVSSTTSSGDWAEFDVIDHIDSNGTFSLGLKTTTDAAGRDWYSEESDSDPVLEITYEP